MRGRRREVKDLRGDVRSDRPPGSSGLEGGRDGSKERNSYLHTSLPMAVGCPTAKAAMQWYMPSSPLSRGV